MHCLYFLFFFGTDYFSNRMHLLLTAYMASLNPLGHSGIQNKVFLSAQHEFAHQTQHGE